MSTPQLVYYITLIFYSTFVPHLVHYMAVLYCRNLTSTPHLAGTAADLKQAEQLKAFWEEQGMTSVTITPFTVLLSYPDQDHPNLVKVIVLCHFLHIITIYRLEKTPNRDCVIFICSISKVISLYYAVQYHRQHHTLVFIEQHMPNFDNKYPTWHNSQLKMNNNNYNYEKWEYFNFIFWYT